MSFAPQLLAHPHRDGEWRVAVAAVVSFALHLALFLFLTTHTARSTVRKTNNITLDVQEVERPRAPPPPPVEKVPSKKIEHLVARVEKVPPKHEIPPPPNQPPPKVAPLEAPPPIHIGVNLESTVQGGAFAAPVGNTMYGVAPVQAPLPEAVKPYWAAKYVAPSRVSELPVLVNEVKVPYPPAARKAGIEGQVILSITIDAEGKVAEVKRISGPGYGLDEAAAKAASKFVWKPARSGGEAVATTIRYVYSFEID